MALTLNALCVDNRASLTKQGGQNSSRNPGPRRWRRNREIRARVWKVAASNLTKTEADDLRDEFNTIGLTAKVPSGMTLPGESAAVAVRYVEGPSIFAKTAQTFDFEADLIEIPSVAA